MTAELSAEEQKAVDDFRREVEDKIGVVFNGCHSTPLERSIHRKQCGDFLVELYATQVREAEWQPIETAPRDGTAVLVWLREYKGRDRFTSYVAQFDGYSWVSVPGKYTWAPTHWQPLPPPPARREGESTVDKLTNGD